MVRLVPEMIYRETIAGPYGPTSGSPFGARLCWAVPEATLVGPRIDVALAAPGMDWLRLGEDGHRRQDQRLIFQDVAGAVILMSYDNGLIRGTQPFLDALTAGAETGFGDQYMRMVARFDTGGARYSWLTESVFIGEGRLAGPRQIEYQIYRMD